MSHDDQVTTIRRMAASGYGDHTIASATGFSVEMIRRLLAVQSDDVATLHAQRWQERTDAT